MAGLLIPPQLQFVDANGAPYAGGLLRTYVPETTTEKLTYLDAAQNTLQSNPIVLDVRGACHVYGDGDYRLVLTDVNGNQVFDLLSSEPLPASAISAAMLPVVGALTLAQARDLLGVTAAINTAISNVSLITGPTGAVGPIGVIGPTGPTGSAGSPTILDGYAVIPPLIFQWGQASSDGGGNVNQTFSIPFPTVCVTVVCTPVNGLGSWWFNLGGITTTGFQGVTSSPLHGGGWNGGPVGVQFFAMGY